MHIEKRPLAYYHIAMFRHGARLPVHRGAGRHHPFLYQEKAARFGGGINVFLLVRVFYRASKIFHVHS
jgi:hypothetical protein